MTTNKPPIIEVRQVTKLSQQKEIIRACNMTVFENTIYGLLGPNGAGKTTLFKLLTGFVDAAAGQIKVFGRNIKTDRNTILKNTGIVIDAPIFVEHLSALRNLEIHCSYMGVNPSDAEKYLAMVGLAQTGDQPVSQFSMGMRQRLGIARAIAHQPKLLILDEPMNGLDPYGIRTIRELFLKLVKEHRMTIIISSHILSEIEQVADTIGVISSGTIVEEVNLAAIKNKFPAGLEDYFFDVLQGGGAI